MLSFLYVYSDHSILECYNLFSGVELSMRSFFVISKRRVLMTKNQPMVYYKRVLTVFQVKKLNGHQAFESMALLGPLIFLLKQHISLS